MTDPNKIAEVLLTRARADLEATGQFMPQAMLLADDATVMVAIDGNIMNSRTQKSDFARKMRAECTRIQAKATVFISDTFQGSQTEEQRRKTRLVEQMLGQSLDVEQMAAAGLCTKNEAIMVVIATLTGSKVICQQYRRNGKSVEFGERQEGPTLPGGRMTDWLESS